MAKLYIIVHVSNPNRKLGRTDTGRLCEKVRGVHYGSATSRACWRVGPQLLTGSFVLGTQRQAGFVACAVGLAHLLLNANIEHVPAVACLKQFPRWLLPTVLNEWGSPFPSMRQRHNRTMLMHLRKPAAILGAFRHRWPNPIEATITMNGPINELPRLPFQIGNFMARTATFLLRLPRHR